MRWAVIGTLTGIALVFGLLIGIGWALWNAIPEPDTRHSSMSPSGERTLHLFEVCFEDSCVHQGILELASVEGPRVQVRCGLDVVATEPLFIEVAMDWAADENTVVIGYDDGAGRSGDLMIDFARDCVGD